MYDKLKQIWNWIKNHIVLIGIGILSLLTLGKYAADRRDDKRAADRDYREREREAEIINQRIERTTELESEFLGDCKDRLEEIGEQLGAAEDTVGRIEQSNVTAEQAIAELRKRFAEDKDKK